MLEADQDQQRPGSTSPSRAEVLNVSPKTLARLKIMDGNSYLATAHRSLLVHGAKQKSGYVPGERESPERVVRSLKDFQTSIIRAIEYDVAAEDKLKAYLRHRLDLRATSSESMSSAKEYDRS